MTQEEFERLAEVAERAAFRYLSPSAQGNLIQDVVSRAVAEYWAVVQRGELVENPEALVTTIATRRALNARRDWNRRRHLRFGKGDDDSGHDMLVPYGDIPRAKSHWDSLEMIELLEAAARDGGDEIDVRIARGAWIDDQSVEDLASDLGLAEKTVRNRMTAIKSRVRDRVRDEDTFG